jgi:hypothetical protein
VKAIRALTRIDLSGAEVSDEAVRSLSAEDAAALLETVEQQLSALTALREWIAEGLG